MITALAELLGKLLDAAKALPGLRRDQKRKNLLRTMLNDPSYQWRGITTLARSIGADEQKTREFLISIGARASTGAGDELWGLVERVGVVST